MTNYAKLPTWADGDHVYAVVETPRGSRAKLEFDPQLGAFTLAKPLLAGLTYPYDWGFIPSTKAQDGDPLDVLIIHDAATYPGLVLKCKPIGVLEVVQSSKGKKERNDRVFVVPGRSPFEGDLQDIRRLPARAIEELERFFEATNALESKKLQFLGSQDRGPARSGPPGSISGSAVSATVHTEGRRPATPDRGCRTRGQNYPEGGMRGAERDLRGPCPPIPGST